MRESFASYGQASTQRARLVLMAAQDNPLRHIRFPSGLAVRGDGAMFAGFSCVEGLRGPPATTALRSPARDIAVELLRGAQQMAITALLFVHEVNPSLGGHQIDPTSTACRE